MPEGKKNSFGALLAVAENNSFWPFLTLQKFNTLCMSLKKEIKQNKNGNH